jgi:heme/copper-type cytochrome/quinol oxidase subunit 2
MSEFRKTNTGGVAQVKSNVIMLLLVLCATAAGTLARQVKDDVDDVKTVEITASKFQFDPATITVTEGDRVRLRLHSLDRPHAFAIKAFRVKALIPRAGETITVEFVADRAGSFDFTCAEYCGTGHARMKGRLVVVARTK